MTQNKESSERFPALAPQKKQAFINHIEAELLRIGVEHRIVMGGPINLISLTRVMALDSSLKGAEFFENVLAMKRARRLVEIQTELFLPAIKTRMPTIQ